MVRITLVSDYRGFTGNAVWPGFEGYIGFVSGKDKPSMAFQASVDAVLFYTDCPLEPRRSSFHLLGVLAVGQLTAESLSVTCFQP